MSLYPRIRSESGRTAALAIGALALLGAASLPATAQAQRWHGGGHWGPRSSVSLGFSFGGPIWGPSYYSPYYYPHPVYVPPPRVVYVEPREPVYVAPAPAFLSAEPSFYSLQTGVQRGTCDRFALNQLPGSQSVPGPEGGTVIGGVYVGPLVGGRIGASMDPVDQACMMQSLEYSRTGDTVAWQTVGGLSIAATPTRTYYLQNGQPCRDYSATAQVGNRQETVSATACRNAAGSWVAAG